MRAFTVSTGVGIREAEVTNGVGLPSSVSFFDHFLDPVTAICYFTYLFQYQNDDRRKAALARILSPE